MKNKIQKVGFGGGCHWCTEAVFQSLIGIENVEQGFIASEDEYNTFSEAVIVHFNPEEISLKDLIEIHLYTHKSTSEHSMRSKYRSAVYSFNETQQINTINILVGLQQKFDKTIITKVLPFCSFKESDELFQNYYYKNPEKPFCETHINPKLSMLMTQFKRRVNLDKLNSKELIS